MMYVMIGAVDCGERQLCYDVRAGLTRSRQPMTIGDTSHVMWQANDGDGDTQLDHMRGRSGAHGLRHSDGTHRLIVLVDAGDNEAKLMTKLAPEWVRTSDPVIKSPAHYRWTTAPAK